MRTCDHHYYPGVPAEPGCLAGWSSRGIRSVTCGRPAKWVAEDKLGVKRFLCGIHRNSVRQWQPNSYVWTPLS